MDGGGSDDDVEKERVRDGQRDEFAEGVAVRPIVGCQVSAYSIGDFVAKDWLAAINFCWLFVKLHIHTWGMRPCDMV